MIRNLTRPLTRGLTRALSPQLLDPDAAAYIAAVQTADGQALEAGIIAAYDAFVRGCKADTFSIVSGDVVAGSTFRNWDRIKASCILAGARTLSGALVPLVGAAPTNNNFVSGDYVRATGLKGDGSTKFLNSNRNNNADPQNNQSMGVYITQQGDITSSVAFFGAGGGANGATQVNRNVSLDFYQPRSRSNTNENQTLGEIWAGTNGISRSKESGYSIRRGAQTTLFSKTSQPPYNGNIGIFARESSGSFGLNTDDRFAFYHIGEALDLAALDARLATLTAALAAALA
jgi:hypothetical protein